MYIIKFKKILATILIFSVVLLLVIGCSSGNDDSKNITIENIKAPEKLQILERAQISTEVKNGQPNIGAKRGKIEGSGSTVDYTAPKTTGEDTITVKTNGPSKTKTVTITKLDQVINAINLEKEDMFINKTQSIELDIINSDLVKEVNWSTNEGSINGSLQANYTASSSQTTATITAEVTTINDNKYTKTKEINLWDSLAITSLSKDKDLVFEGETVNLSLDYVAQNTPESIKWLHNSTQIGTGENISYSNSPGSYVLTAKIVGQDKTVTKDIVVDILANPTLDATNSLNTGETATLTVNNTNSYIDSYNWTNVKSSNQDTATFEGTDSNVGDNQVSVDIQYSKNGNTRTKTLSKTISVYKLVQANGTVKFKRQQVTEEYSDDEVPVDNVPFTSSSFVDGTWWFYAMLQLDHLYKYNESDLEGLETARVAVIDTGIDKDHPYLTYNESDSLTTNDDDGHGTKVSGIIGMDENTTRGIKGVAPNAELIIMKMAGSDGIAAAIEYASGKEKYIGGELHQMPKADVINFSRIGIEDTGINEAIDTAISNNLAMVCASGNQNNDVKYPANKSNTIAVGAIVRDYSKKSNSNYGPELDFVAPDGYYTTFNNGDYITANDTSMTTPIITGITALLKGQNKSLSQSEIKDLLAKYSFDLGDSNKFGFGVPGVYNLFNRVHLDDVKVFLGQVNDNTITKLSDFQSLNYSSLDNLAQTGDINFEQQVQQSYKILAWADVNNNNQIDNGDFLAKGSENTESVNLKLDVIKKDYILN